MVPSAGPGGPEAARPARLDGAAAQADWSCRFVIEPDVDPSVVPGPVEAVLEFCCGSPLMADTWLAARKPSPHGPVVYLTRRPLATARCASVFGYACRRTRAAVVSLAQLETGDPGWTRRRVAAVAAHELGHLAGYRHCRAPGCLMRPAETVEDVDARLQGLCPACRRRGRRLWPLAVLLMLACLAASLGLDAVIERVRNRSQVFTWRAAGAGASVVLGQEEILRLKDPASAQAAVEALNSLYASMTPPPLRLESGAGAVRVTAGGRLVVDFVAADTRGEPAGQFARRWVSRVEPVIQGKGPWAEGCPSCHVSRRGEVLDAMARRSRWWR
jgi:hypothetical protein